MNEESEIRKILKAREAAVAASDAEAAVAAMVPGALSYDLPPPLSYEYDHDAAVEGLNGWFDTWNGPVQSELVDPVIMISGDLAVAHGVAHMTGDKKGEGPQDVWFRSTVVLHQTDGEWRIIHEHNSFPMKMDGSGEAATDLKPE